MAEDTELNEDTIIPILDNLRKPNGDNKCKNGKISRNRRLKTFDDIVSAEWDNLKLGGAPDPKLIELILINSINELYGGWNQETDETERKKKARMRDANLLSFGLLDGYYHTKKGVNTWLSDRYEEYLKKTDFVKIDYPGEGSYEEIARKDKIRKPGKQPRPLGSLTHFVSDGKEQIAFKVFDVIHGKTYKDYLDKDGKVPMFKLPKPCYTLKNFPFPTKQDGSSSLNPLPIEDETDDYMPKDEPEKSDEQGLKSDTEDSGYPFRGDWRDIPTKYLIFGGIVLFLLLGFIIISLFIVIRHNDNSAQKAFSETLKTLEQKEQKSPDNIEIKDNNIYLPWGGDYHLYVEINGLNTDNLKCKSSDSGIVEVLSKTDEYIKVTKGLDDDMRYDSGVIEYHIKAKEKNLNSKKDTKDSVDIVVHNDGENYPKDEVTIIVFDPNGYNNPSPSSSRGKNDTKSPGDIK